MLKVAKKKKRCVYVVPFAKHSGLQKLCEMIDMSVEEFNFKNCYI
jgi:hypothetical protein